MVKFRGDARLNPTQVDDRRRGTRGYDIDRLVMPKAWDTTARWLGYPRGFGPTPFPWDPVGSEVHKTATKTVGGQGNRPIERPSAAEQLAEQRQGDYRRQNERRWGQARRDDQLAVLRAQAARRAPPNAALLMRLAALRMALANGKG